jgi:hypothetical protein
MIFNRFYTFKSCMFGFHSAYGVNDRHIISFLYSPFFLYMGIRDLVCWIDLCPELLPPFVSFPSGSPLSAMRLQTHCDIIDFSISFICLSLACSVFPLQMVLAIGTSLVSKVKVTLRPTYESASPSWRQAPIWDPRPN